jgi:hypothetical protein
VHPRLAILAVAALVSLPTAPSTGRLAAAGVARGGPVQSNPGTDQGDPRMGGRVAVREVYRTVDSFGLRADGATPEGGRLNAAIETLSRAGGGHLVIPAGTTVYAGPTRVILRRNVSLEGGGPGSGIRWGGPGLERGIQVMGSNSAVRNLILTGAAAARGHQQFAAWMDGAVKDVALEGNVVRRWHVAVCVRTFKGTSPRDFTIAGNRVERPVRWRVAHQVQVISMINHSAISRIRRFRVDGNTLLGAPNGGIFIDGGHTFSISANRIVSTVGPAVGGSMIGVYTEFGGDTIDGTVARNTIIGNGREVAGIELNAGLDEITIQDNVVVGARDGVAFYPGIEHDRYPRSHDVVIRRNRITRPTRVGFRLDGAVDHLTYEDNVVVAPRVDGFYLNVHAPKTTGANAVALTLRRNLVVNGRGANGFWIGDATRVLFERNTVCHGGGSRPPAVGLRINPMVGRLQGQGNFLEGSVAPIRYEGNARLARRLTDPGYAPTLSCPPPSA